MSTNNDGSATSQIDNYARGVVAGKRSAGRLHRLCCERHLQDRKRAREDTSWPFRWSGPDAARLINFCSALQHTKGRWARTRWNVEPWQRFILGSLAGWRARQDRAVRRYRYAYIEIPRKNGKTYIGAALALYYTFFAGEPGAEGYSLATKSDQARLVYDQAKSMVYADPDLRRRIHPAGKWQSSLTLLGTGGERLQPLSKDYSTLDGLSPSLVVIDELHAHATRQAIDVMATAMGARESPLLAVITTAGVDGPSPCREEHDYGAAVLEGTTEDDRRFVFVAHAEADDDPYVEATWLKTNPNLGISVSVDDMRQLARQARSGVGRAAFLQKRINQWVADESDPYLSLSGWDEGVGAAAAGFRAPPVVAMGIDLASVTDTACIVVRHHGMAANGERVVRLSPWLLTPSEGLDQRGRRARAPYRAWVEAGDLDTCPGSRIDQDQILARALELVEECQVTAIGIDPWHADGLITALARECGHLPVIAVPQHGARFGAAAKAFQADVLAGAVDHGAHPVMRWHALNARADEDRDGNLRPSKRRSRGAIDAISATICAYSAADAAADGAEDESVYNTRGVVVI